MEANTHLLLLLLHRHSPSPFPPSFIDDVKSISACSANFDSDDYSQEDVVVDDDEDDFNTIVTPLSHSMSPSSLPHSHPFGVPSYSHFRLPQCCVAHKFKCYKDIIAIIKPNKIKIQTLHSPKSSSKFDEWNKKNKHWNPGKRKGLEERTNS